MIKYQDSHEIKVEALISINQALTALGHEAIASLPPGHIKCPVCCAGAKSFASGLPQPVEVYSNTIGFRDYGDAATVAAAWQSARRFRFRQPHIEYTEGTCGSAVYEIRMPLALSYFVLCFDQGDFPELVIKNLALIDDPHLACITAQSADIDAFSATFSIHPAHSDLVV